jgi:hypothetical protein
MAISINILLPFPVINLNRLLIIASFDQPTVIDQLIHADAIPLDPFLAGEGGHIAFVGIEISISSIGIFEAAKKTVFPV